MIDVRRSADRFETAQPGITTRHCFSSGAHYDSGNVSFGALTALDEHVVAPGAGFARHAHRGVGIVSWVLDGVLRHEDASSRVELVEPGTAQVQRAGSGIEHAERNGSDSQPLRFVQVVLLGDSGEPGYQLGRPPMRATAGLFDVRAAPLVVEARLVHLYVTRGTIALGRELLSAGDSVRVSGEAVAAEGNGELLVWLSAGAADV